MTKVIRHIGCFLNGIGNSFSGRYETSIPEITAMKANLYKNRTTGGFAEDRRNLKADGLNIGIDLQKAISKAKKTL